MCVMYTTHRNIPHAQNMLTAYSNLNRLLAISPSQPANIRHNIHKPILASVARPSRLSLIVTWVAVFCLYLNYKAFSKTSICVLYFFLLYLNCQYTVLDVSSYSFNVLLKWDVVVVFLHTVFIGLALLFCPFRKAKQTKKKTHPYNPNKFSNTKGRKAAHKPYK